MKHTEHGDETITIWGAGTPRTFRPLWVAEELGLDYEHQAIGPRTGETQTASYTALNPKQKVPLLTCGSFVLSESMAISRYLARKYRDASIFWRPGSMEDQAIEDQWLSYIFGEIDETSLYVMRRHGDLCAVFGDAPVAFASAKAYAEKHFNIISEHLAGQAYLLGDHFGLSDVLLTSCLDWANFYEVTISASLEDYRLRNATRPAYDRAYTKNYPTSAGD